MASQYSTTARNAAADAIAALLNAGKVRIYDGAQPANANTAITTQTMLAELTLNATAFGAAVAGVCTANAITNATAAASGTAAWCRFLKSDGVTVVMDGTVSTSGANLILNALAIAAGVTVSVSSLTLTDPASGA